jgi:hypothetical protein
MTAIGEPADMLQHFDEVSVYGDSRLALLVILGVDLVFSGIHAYQEWKGRGAPIWRYLGAIAGTRIPDGWGFLGFTVVLTIVLWGLALVGMAGVLIDNPCWRAFALGTLIGARVSDSFVSHVIPTCSGFQPNPGLSSVSLYLAEAPFIAFAFQKGLGACPSGAASGIAAGALFFIAVIPLLRLLRWIIPSWRQQPWLSGQPIPKWTSTSS